MKVLVMTNDLVCLRQKAGIREDEVHAAPVAA